MEFTKYDEHGDLTTYKIEDLNPDNYDDDTLNYLSEQLNLEADVTYGREPKVNRDMITRYPAAFLIKNIVSDHVYNGRVKAGLMRLFTNLYIDDDEHTEIRYERCYRVDEEHEDSFRVTSKVTKEDFDKLFVWIKRAVRAFFETKSRGVSSLTENTFWMNLIYMCKLLLRFGLYTHRSGENGLEDLNEFSGFIIYVLDIFTGRTYSSSFAGLE